MLDFCLKFSNEEEAKTVLPSFVQDVGGKLVWKNACFDFCLDAIGPLVITEAIFDAKTFRTIATAVLDNSFHLNIRLFSENLLSEVKNSGGVIFPKERKRQWA